MFSCVVGAVVSNFEQQKKILHVITGLNDGGAEGVLARLCVHSKQPQHVVISLMDAGKYGPLLTDAGVTVYCLNMNPGKASIVHLFRLIKLIRVERPDVVQTWMYHADLLGGVAARLSGVRRVFWGVRHSTLEKGSSKQSTILIARLCAMLSKWIPEKIICCAHTALEVHANIGYDSSRLLVIPNGYDLARFKPDLIQRVAVRNELGFGQQEFLIGKVGRYDPQKDHYNLLRALSLVAAQKIEFRCVLIGKGLTEKNDALMAQITELGLHQRVMLIGQRTDIPAVMNALDLHVLSSSFGEAFPNVVAEAMACGTPCVTTDVGDALEIVGSSDVCCPPRDPQLLAKLILSMHDEWINSSNIWLNRKISCVERIHTNFSIGAMVAAYESCWLRN